MVRTSILIDVDLLERLKAVNASCGISEAEQIRRGIRMWLESREGLGRRHVSLSRREREPRRAMRRSVRILLVNDETAIPGSFTPLLASKKYEIEVVWTRQLSVGAFDTLTPALAVEALDKLTPDLIVFNPKRPGAEADDFYQQIRALSAIPVLVLSAPATDVHTGPILDQEADDDVLQPVNLEALLAHVEVHALARPAK